MLSPDTIDAAGSTPAGRSVMPRATVGSDANA